MTSIDLTYLESVAAGDKEFIKQMLQMFRTSTMPEMEKTERFFAKEDWTMVGLTAHKIKAPVQMLGQTELVDLILELEKSGRTLSDPVRIQTLITTIKSKLVDLNEEVDSFVASF